MKSPLAMENDAEMCGGEFGRRMAKKSFDAFMPLIRAQHYREAAAHLDRRAPQEEALGHYTEAHGYRAAAAELRRLATTEGGSTT